MAGEKSEMSVGIWYRQRCFGLALLLRCVYRLAMACDTCPTLCGDIQGLHDSNDFCYMGVGTAYGFVSRYPLKAPLLA